MSKQRYLAELQRLLIFMTSADREETVRRYGALFDACGPEGEEELTRRVGSPTAVAIRLSHSYEPGVIRDEFFPDGSPILAPEPEPEAEEPAPGPETPEPEAEEGPAPEPEPEEAPASPPEDRLPVYDHSLVEEELPDLELPDLGLPDLPIPPAPEPEPVAEEPEPEGPAEEEPDGTVPEPEPAPGPEPAAEEPAPEPEEAPAPAPQPARPAPVLPPERPAPRFISVPLDHRPQERRPAPEPVVTVKRSMPLAAGVPLFILVLIAAAVPLGAVLLVLLPLLLLPGLAILAAAWLTAVGGLWCVSYIADAVMLFGAAFFILGLALMALFLGLWLDVALVRLYIRLLTGMKHLFLGRKVISRA